MNEQICMGRIYENVDNTASCSMIENKNTLNYLKFIEIH